MQESLEILRKKLRQLSRKDRLDMVHYLLTLEEKESGDNEIDLAWEKEITTRIKAIDEGWAKGIDYDMAMQELKKEKFHEC